MNGLIKPWLKSVSWSSVVAINASLCKAGRATHKPTSDGYETARLFWEQNRTKEFGLQELLQICFKCHRLAPFCNYNGNTFAAIVKTLLAETLNRVSADKAHVILSIAGHIVAGTATQVENKQLDEMLDQLGK